MPVAARVRRGPTGEAGRRCVGICSPTFTGLSHRKPLNRTMVGAVAAAMPFDDHGQSIAPSGAPTTASLGLMRVRLRARLPSLKTEKGDRRKRGDEGNSLKSQHAYRDAWCLRQPRDGEEHHEGKLSRDEDLPDMRESSLVCRIRAVEYGNVTEHHGQRGQGHGHRKECSWPPIAVGKIIRRAPETDA